jgi:colanic acid/amylovoran biosynthesis glycosyltransferase
MLKEKTGEAAFVVPISRFNRTVILQASDGEYADKMHIVHCGVDTQRFQRAARRPPGPGPGKKHTPLICVRGHPARSERPDLLAEACRILKEKGPPFTCHFIGDGPDQATLTAGPGGRPEWTRSSSTGGSTSRPC